ncbi:MAG: class I SAM-dependent methyltransferase [Solirubrobacteraceae bacterium]
MSEAIWHDLECGGYAEDLELWQRLADAQPGAVLDVGAGTGRTTLPLARTGHAVLAMDLEDELLAVLRERADGLQVRTLVGDARAFGLGEEFGLCIVPMQTVQLLGGAAGRGSFLECARMHLEPGGLLAVAIAEELECFEVVDGGPGPLPDVHELDGVVYCSRAVGVRVDGDGFELERRRETVAADGGLTVQRNLIHLDALDADTLEREAAAAGFAPAGRRAVGATDDYVGSTVVVLRA